MSKRGLERASRLSKCHRLHTCSVTQFAAGRRGRKVVAHLLTLLDRVGVAEYTLPSMRGRRSIFWDVAARRNNGRSFAGQFEERYGSRRGFAVFPSESRTEGGRRQESEDPGVEIVRQAVIWSCLRGFCRLPRSMAGSGNGKIVRQEQPGAPARNPPNRRPEAGRL